MLGRHVDIPRLDLGNAEKELTRNELEIKNIREIKSYLYGHPAAPPPSIRSADFRREGISIPKAASKRTFKILSFKSGLGKDKLRTEYYDLITGKLVHAEPIRAGGTRMVCNDVIGYESKDGALSEQRGKSSSPRVLVSFDGWGYTLRRRVGPPSYLFEFGSVVKILGNLDKIATLQGPAHFDTPIRTRNAIDPEEMRKIEFRKITGEGQVHHKDAWGKLNDFSDGTVEAAVLNRSEALLKAQKEATIKHLPGVEMADNPQFQAPVVKLPARKKNYLASFAVSSDKLVRMPQEKPQILFKNSPTKPPLHLVGMSKLIEDCMR